MRKNRFLVWLIVLALLAAACSRENASGEKRGTTDFNLIPTATASPSSSSQETPSPSTAPSLSQEEEQALLADLDAIAMKAADLPLDAAYDFVAIPRVIVREISPGALHVSYVVMVTIPERPFIAPQSKEEKEEQAAAYAALRGALVTLLRKTASLAVTYPELQTVGIRIYFPTAVTSFENIPVSIIDYGVTVSALRALSKDASDDAWLGTLAAMPIVEVPAATLQKLLGSRGPSS